MKRHKFDVMSFFSAILALMVGGAFLAGVDELDVVADWLVPAVLLVIGLTIVGAALQRFVGERQPSTDDTEFPSS